MNCIWTRDEAGVPDADLFAGLFGTSGGGEFRRWQVARRRGHVLLLARPGPGSMADALRFYRTLRPAGLLYKAMLEVVSRSPLWRGLPTLGAAIEPDAFAAEFERQAGRTITAVLLGNPVQVHRRAIFRAESRADDPWVVKVGFGPRPRAAVRRERCFLEALSNSLSGVPAVVWRYVNESAEAFATMEQQGRPLQNPERHVVAAVDLLRCWARFEERRPAAALPMWKRVIERWCGSGSAAGRLEAVELCGALSHGDFSAWNLLVRPDGSLRAVDWEWGDGNGVAGWDLVHFFYQESSMVRRLADSEAISWTLARLREPPAAGFLADCGWRSAELALATYLCGLNPIFRSPAPEALHRLCRAACG